MKRITILLCLFTVSILAFKPAGHESGSDTTVENGWIELINGKDFTGWKASENASTWSVTEGTFQAVGKRSHLFYEGEHLKDGFKNFELEVKVKTFWLANSGIYFHTVYQESGWPSQGMEIQVNNTHIGEGDYIELKKMGSLYAIRNLYKTFGRDNEWMTVKARIESNRVQVWLNGVKTVDYLQPENTPSGMRRLGKGTFCLQGHDPLSKMQYKSFRVRRLPDNSRSNLTAPVLGTWYDSLATLQGQQFAFIDLNPKTSLPVKDLTSYLYNTGINVAIVRDPATAGQLAAAKNLPLFTGIKVTAKNQRMIQPSATAADYIIGESTDLQTAQALLMGTKINIWSDKGQTLNSDNAAELLDMAKRNEVAIEIDNMNHTPSVELIKMAKAKGCKFTFAGLVPAAAMEKSMYVAEAIKEAKLTYKDQYIPKW
jgi:hypothetical protein